MKFLGKSGFSRFITPWRKFLMQQRIISSSLFQEQALSNKIRFFSSKSSDRDHQESEGPDDLSYMRGRWADLKHMQEVESSFNPYPHTFKTTHSIPEFNSAYQSLSSNERRPEIKVSISGRVNSIRRSGKSLVFLELKGDGSKLQV